MSFRVAVSPSANTFHLIIVFCVSVCLSFLHSVIVPVRHTHEQCFMCHCSKNILVSGTKTITKTNNNKKNPLTLYPPYPGNIQMFCSAHCLFLQIYQHFVTERLLQRLTSYPQSHVSIALKVFT